MVDFGKHSQTKSCETESDMQSLVNIIELKIGLW
jgi:hypothetical protein